MIWNPEMETMPRDQLRGLQLRRLQEVAQRVYQQVPLYRKRFDDAGVLPEQIRALSDLPRLPFTRKADFRDTYPFGLFTLPLDEILRLHASSGTTGKPTVVGYTRSDVKVWAEVCARCLAASGAQPGDVFQNAYGYGLFTGGLGMHYGAELLGLCTVPVSGGNTERQITLLQDFGARVIACTPSYALVLAEALRQRGIPPGALRLRIGILGAEPWTEAMRDEIERRLGIDALNIYGLSEVIGPGVSNECLEEKDGAHIFEDHFLPEVVEPQSGEPLPPGAYGELVFTTLTKEAMPVIRYRSGDIAALIPDPCRCGRTHARMSRVVGRTDDMLIIRGINVYPSQVEAALGGLAELSPHYHLIVTRQNGYDDLEIKVEVSEEFSKQFGGGLPADVPAIEELLRRCREKLLGVLALNAQVTLMGPGTLPRSEGGKLRRVDDRRPKG